MFTILLSLLALSGGHCVQEIPLELAFPRGMDHQFLQLTPDSILVSQHFSIIEIDLDGQLRGTYTFADGFDISNFSYLHTMDLIAVVLGRKTPEVEHRILLLEPGSFAPTSEGRIPVYDPDAVTPENVYTRQIIETNNGRLFTNQWNWSMNGEDQLLLQEMQLKPFADGYGFIERGKPFSLQQPAFEKFSASFKQRFVIEHGGSLQVLSQLQPLLRTYTQALGKRDLVEEVEVLRLQDWVQPYQEKQSNTREARLRWRFSFSRNIGLHRLDVDGSLLLGYMSPNQNHPFYTQSSEADDHAALFVLNLQKLKADGTRDGDPIQLPGTYLVGTDAMIAYVLKPLGESEYSLCALSL